MPAFVSRLKDGATDRWRRLQAARPGIAHAVKGYQHYQAQHGDVLAAAITFFSFLSLFPLILLGVSITGFVLAAQPHLQTELFSHIATSVPGSFGTTLSTAIDSAIKQRTATGIVGLVGVAFTGLGWIANLRTAVDVVWGLPARGGNFVTKKLSDALVLFGLGLGIVISLGITAGGTAASGYVLRLIGADHLTGAGTLTAIIAFALGIAGSMVVFGWIMIRLPDIHVTRKTALRSSLLAAVGFEILKAVGTAYIAKVTKSPAAAAIGPALGILVWTNLVSRFLLFCVAWAAKSPWEPAVPVAEGPVEGPPVGPVRRPGFSPAGVAASLVSAGAALGAGSLAILLNRRRSQENRPPPQ